MTSHLLRLSGLLLLGGLCSCQSPAHRSTPAPHAEMAPAAKHAIDLSARNNAWALLDELLNEEKHVSKILIIKRESRELKNLIKNISETADQGADRMKKLAKHLPGLDLTATTLPAGEKAVRESIAQEKKHLLLHSSGAEFEFQLLLTQFEALGYGSHLARVIAENEPQPAQAREFSDLSAHLHELQEQVLAMLRPPK